MTNLDKDHDETVPTFHNSAFTLRTSTSSKNGTFHPDSTHNQEPGPKPTTKSLNEDNNLTVEPDRDPERHLPDTSVPRKRTLSKTNAHDLIKKREREVDVSTIESLSEPNTVEVT